MLYIIRHGQTELNNAFALQGRSDHPLNQTGVEQAARAGRWLAQRGVAFSRVYSSPLQRAVQTARIVAPGAHIVVDDRLVEMDYGPYEGADLRSPAPEIAEFFSDFVHNRAPEGMEQLDEVVARTGAFVDELFGAGRSAVAGHGAGAGPGADAAPADGAGPTGDAAPMGDVLVSTHAIAMKGILEYLTPDSGGAYWSKNIRNCAVYVAEVTGGRVGVPTELVMDEGR